MTEVPDQPTGSGFDPFVGREYCLTSGQRTLVCSPRRVVHVMGILNVTPDSFSDGGQYLNEESAIRRAEAMLREGASIIDVGGESTRPRGNTYGEGASVVDEDEEKRRILPIINAIARRFPEVIISVDTYKPAVARAAIDAGAGMLNDVTGLRYDDMMARLAARFNLPLVLMHSLGRPGEMPHEHRYSDVVVDVKKSLATSIDRARAAGAHQLVVDPGIGFGKSVQENLTLAGRCDALLAWGFPVLVGVSRKATIGAVLGSGTTPRPVGERLFGSLGATAAAVISGATLVRSHDVLATVEMLSLLTACLPDGPQSR
jgi:dihydropteroate synthase